MVCTLFWALSFKSTLVWSPTPGKRHILSWELTTWGNFIVPVAWQLLLQIFSTLLAIFTFLSNFFFLPNYFIHSLLVFKYLPWPFSCFIYCFAFYSPLRPPSPPHLLSFLSFFPHSFILCCPSYFPLFSSEHQPEASLLLSNNITHVHPFPLCSFLLLLL